MAQPGDTVKIKTKDETITGILMPTPDSSITVVKLDSGYNIGIDNKKIEKIELVKKPQATSKTDSRRRTVDCNTTSHKPQATSFKQQTNNLPKITVLHTGGTIASKVDYSTGGVVARFTPVEILAMFPELRQIANINSTLISNMWSEDMRFAHYNKMAKEVEKEIKKGAHGIIITHGTDTMHYTSAALAFILEDCPVPVILVGAQRSSDRGSSDAGINLINAAYFITNTDFYGVAICMHETMDDKNCLILPALKTRKMHTSRRDAFRPINTAAIARVNYDEKNISFTGKDYATKKKENKLTLRLFSDKLKIGMLKAHPNMSAAELKPYAKFDGLVLEGTGLGQFPINQTDKDTKEHSKIFKELEKLSKKMPVVMASQCIYGRIQMNVYSTARKLQDIGVSGNLADMTPETAFIKLAWLISNRKKNEVRELITKNIRGEISERTEKQGFLA